ncbi:hypothetical protein C2G38_2192588 [Gigaspora rosea]|uniref:Uncharacterized protein n=1 Tax=Gigaspora rosea TaxID=44941 RepID=A0A397UYP4_9GLOM|nr:hypothetical protein C2G38_2192588 [Gigaspora rosea]
MEELQQSNQELHEVVSQLAESNRNFKQRLYTLERIIDIREERIQFLEKELNNTIELSRQDKEKLLEEISKLKGIICQLEKKIKRKIKKFRIRMNRLELINTREALQNAEAQNFNENESDTDENSLDIYNFD